MACDFGLKGLGYGSRLPWFGAVSLGKTLKVHLYVHSLDPGVNGYLFGYTPNAVVELLPHRHCVGANLRAP